MASIVAGARPVDTAETAATPALANPAPLGLSAFALTTFVLSAINAKLLTGAPGDPAVTNIVVGLALFYGGLAQLLAGMWEFKTGNTFGATAFSSYGAFWLAVAASLQLKLIPNPQAFGFFLLGWTIFTAMLFVCTLRLSAGLMVLFGLLAVTFLLLTLGEFGSATAHLFGGYLGIATALVAWYNALAGLLVSVKSPFVLPVGPRS